MLSASRLPQVRAEVKSIYFNHPSTTDTWRVMQSSLAGGGTQRLLFRACNCSLLSPSSRQHREQTLSQGLFPHGTTRSPVTGQHTVVLFDVSSMFISRLSACCQRKYLYGTFPLRVEEMKIHAKNECFLKNAVLILHRI